MNIVYLGIFQTILNWIIEKIFSPVFKFIANLLGTVFGWIFDEILGPLLVTLVKPVLKIFIDLIFEALAGVFYRILVSILTLVDYIQIAFDVLIGIRNVSYTTASGEVMKEPLLDVLFYQGSVQKAFWMIVILALSMAFIFTIYATAKSAFDLDFEGRRPVGMVLKSLFRAALNFLTVPLFVLFMLKLSGIILIGVNLALTQEATCTLGNTIFLVASMDAAKAEGYNVSSENKKEVIGFEDEVRRPYAKGDKSYANIEGVTKEFNLGRIDYIVGYGVSIFLLIILAICLIQFVQRIFEIIMLFVVSPLFVSVMPLDDGEKFSGWRELFVAKCFTGFGAAFGMRLYLMVISIIMGNTIDFTAGGSISREMDYVLKLLIVMGGAFAIFKSSSMLTMLMSWRAADTEMATAAAVGGTLYAHSVGTVTHSMYGGIQRAFEHGGSKEKESKGQAFQGGRGLSDGSGTGSARHGISGKAGSAAGRAPGKAITSGLKSGQALQGAAGKGAPVPAAKGAAGKGAPVPAAKGTAGKGAPVPAAKGTAGGGAPGQAAKGAGGKGAPVPAAKGAAGKGAPVPAAKGAGGGAASAPAAKGAGGKGAPVPAAKGAGGKGAPAPAAKGAAGKGAPAPAAKGAAGGAAPAPAAKGAAGKGAPAPAAKGAAGGAAPAPAAKGAAGKGAPAPAAKGAAGGAAPTPAAKGAGGKGAPVPAAKGAAGGTAPTPAAKGAGGKGAPVPAAKGAASGATPGKTTQGTAGKGGSAKDTAAGAKDQASRDISFGKNESGRVTMGYKGRHLKFGRGTDRGRGVQLDGRLIRRKTHEDGSVTVNAPFVSLKAGPNGGKLKWNGLNMGVFKTRKGADGKQHLAGVNLGVVKLRRDESGRMKVKSVNVKAARFERMDDGRLHATRALGQEVEQTKDLEGRYRTTGVKFEKHDTHLSFKRSGMTAPPEEEDASKKTGLTPAQAWKKQQRINLTPAQRQRIERSKAVRRQSAGDRPGEAANRPPIVRNAVRNRERTGRQGGGNRRGKR